MTQYIPAIYVLGYWVRSLYWEGYPGGTIHGIRARMILQCCLGLQLDITGDHECRLEYSRSLSVALLTWQPWMSRLPGCCFAEEPCEALLSRVASRCRQQRQLTQFTDVLRLFVTTPRASTASTTATDGSLREPFVKLVMSRLMRVITNADQLPVMQVAGAERGTWLDNATAQVTMPGDYSSGIEVGAMETCLRSAVVSVTGRAVLSAETTDTAQALLPLVHEEGAILRDRSMVTVRKWATERTARRQQTQQQV